MHFVGPDQLHGYEQRLTTDVYPADLDWTPDWRAPLAGERRPWYHSMESVLDPACARRRCRWTTTTRSPRGRCAHLFDHARGDDRPFFLTVSFTHPHDPWELRRRVLGPLRRRRRSTRRRSGRSRARRPIRTACGCATCPASTRPRSTDAQVAARAARLLRGHQLRRRAHRRGAGRAARVRARGGHDRRCSRATTASCSGSAGSGTRWRSSTRRRASRCSSARRAAIAPARVSQPVSLLDLAPTLLELAGLDPVDGLDGRSLAPALAGAALADADVVAEYLAEGVSAPAVMLRPRAPQVRLVRRRPGAALRPRGRPARAAQPGSRRSGALRRALRRGAPRAGISARCATRCVRSQDERRLVARALRAGQRDGLELRAAAGSPASCAGGDDLYAVQRRLRLDDPT